MIKENKKIFVLDKSILSIIAFKYSDIIKEYSDIVVFITSNIKEVKKFINLLQIKE